MGSPSTTRRTSPKNERGKDLYRFWGDGITEQLNDQLGSLKMDTVVNLASVEYFKSVNTSVLQADVIAPAFLDLRNGSYKIISFYAKKARGLMSAWIIKNRIDDPKLLKGFDVAGYRYNAELSVEGKPAFARDEKPA